MPLPRSLGPWLLFVGACAVRGSTAPQGSGGHVPASGGDEPAAMQAEARSVQEEPAPERPTDAPPPASPAARAEADATTAAASGEAAGAGGPARPVEPAAPTVFRRSARAPRFASVSLGGGQTLELRKMRVSVVVEGFRARTIVDHIFHNPH